MANKLSLKEAAEEIEAYLNDRGLWNDFKGFIEAKRIYSR